MEYTALDCDGLILFDRVRGLVGDARVLRRDVERGILVKLRRGAFVERSRWDQLEPRDRHLLRIHAVAAVAREPVIVAGESAAAVWGMPIAGDWPAEVTIMQEWRGGGRSEPGVRRTAAGFTTARIDELDGLRVTSLSRTALDVARRASFPDAIASLDWALWRKNPRAVSKEELQDELRRLNPRARARHLERALEFSTSLSDSFGESKTRAVIHLLGFAAPELQVEFRDSQGTIQPDFFWRSVMHAAEFDGKAKYTRQEYTHGNPGEVVWREKKREDRLRRAGCGVTRILTEHVEHPHRLETMLLEAGIPRGGKK